MLLAHTIATDFAQNCPSLPNFVKICPKSMSKRNFGIPPKFDILVLSGKKILYIKDAAKFVLAIWISNATIFGMPFYCQKMPFVCKFQH
jgi:hypothetical protein